MKLKIKDLLEINRLRVKKSQDDTVVNQTYKLQKKSEIGKDRYYCHDIWKNKNSNTDEDCAG